MAGGGGKWKEPTVLGTREALAAPLATVNRLKFSRIAPKAFKL